MHVREYEPLKSKTTMHIGGKARYFAELETKEDAEEACTFAEEKGVPLFVLGAGSNTIFADGTVEAFVVRIKDDAVSISDGRIRCGAGKTLAALIHELAGQGLDLSALAGIPGTLGGAIIGNAGQGPKKVWMDTFVKTVLIFHEGSWRTLQKEECGFGYRSSVFKRPEMHSGIIWEAVLSAPKGDPEDIAKMIETHIKSRIETQPHRRTAGSCFAAPPDGTPAWQMIDDAGLRGLKVGGMQISEKHANFLLNAGDAAFEDATAIIREIQTKIPALTKVEMRIIRSDGTPAFE